MIQFQRGPFPPWTGPAWSRGAPTPRDSPGSLRDPGLPAGPGILLLDLCYRPNSLSADEFVAPLERIVRQEGHPPRVRHYTQVTRKDLASADGILLCGTAIADCDYLDRMELFAWLSPCTRPVLGICAGMQVIVKLFGGEVSPGVGIGMAGQRVVAPDPLLSGRDRFEAYELHGLSVVPPPSFLVLVTSASGIQVIRHPDRPVYGVMFHPEVRNEWMVRRFLALCSSLKAPGEEGD